MDIQGKAIFHQFSALPPAPCRKSFDKTGRFGHAARQFPMGPIGSRAMKTTMNLCGAVQDRPQGDAGQNKPGQRGADRACLRNAFIKGVSAWRIVNQFALSNFVLIPFKTRKSIHSKP